MTEVVIPRQPLCPTPDKSRFATMEAASEAVNRAGFALNKKLYVYETCPCGWLHLTSKKSRADPNAKSVLSPGIPVDDAVFANLVRRDVVGASTPQDAAALRESENVPRWADALKSFQIDLAAQLAARAGVRDAATVEWRARIAKVQYSLRLRRTEAKQLMQERSLGSMRQDKDYLPGQRAKLKDRRGEAGERAVKRLKDAHSLEFVTYLQEEYEKAGLEPSPGFAKYFEKSDQGRGEGDMNDDMTTWQCPRCPVTFEAFVDDAEGDASDGMSKQEAYNQLDDHMASVHGMADEQIYQALAEQTAKEMEET